jgi:SAM-dependent methyltransferase
METYWLELWRELAEAFLKPGPGADEGMVERFRAAHREKAARPDRLLGHVLTQVGAGASVLDVGAGTGRWTIPLAQAARRVTALEPTPAMEEMLRASIEKAGLENVEIAVAGWRDAAVEPHDVAVAAHSMYTSPDLLGFVRFMDGHARRACYLEMRLPPADGIIGELSLRIHGSTHDSPNAVVAYNALYAMGICVNVLVEEDCKYRVDATFDEALKRTKAHLRLEHTTEHDDLIRSTLEERLTQTEAGWRWPDGKRSALLWWEPGGPARERSAPRD